MQWEVAGGTWATWQSGVTTTSAKFGQGSAPVRPTAGKTYALRAFATDPYGNTSVKPAAMFVELKDDRAATARGGWSSLHAKTAWLGTTRATTHAKASLSIGLTGSTLWLIGDRLPHGSRADVYVDGKKVATIDTHGSTAHRHILWSKRVKKGHHVVKVVNLASPGGRTSRWTASPRPERSCDAEVMADLRAHRSVSVGRTPDGSSSPPTCGAAPCRSAETPTSRRPSSCSPRSPAARRSTSTP